MFTHLLHVFDEFTKIMYNCYYPTLIMLHNMIRVDTIFNERTEEYNAMEIIAHKKIV